MLLWYGTFEKIVTAYNGCPPLIDTGIEEKSVLGFGIGVAYIYLTDNITNLPVRFATTLLTFLDIQIMTFLSFNERAKFV